MLTLFLIARQLATSGTGQEHSVTVECMTCHKLQWCAVCYRRVLSYSLKLPIIGIGPILHGLRPSPALACESPVLMGANTTYYQLWLSLSQVGKFSSA